MLQIVGQNKRVDFDNVDIINSLKMLIQKFKELKEKHADLKDIIEDKERFNELFNVIGEILTTLRQSGEFNNETIEKLYNIYQNIMERYNNLYKNTIDNELNEVNEDTKLHTTPKFPFSEYGLKQPANEELKKIPLDIEKVDKENRRESIVKTEIVKLNVDIDLLIGALNKVIDIINKKYNISQEQTEPEIISSTELATIEKKSWFQKIIGRIKTFFSSEEKIVADVPYEEVGSKNKEFVKELRIEEKKDLPEEESSMSESEKEANFVEEWNKRLIEYIRKIDEGKFSVKDVPNLIDDLYRIDDRENEEIIKNKRDLQDRLEKIKKILAKHFKCWKKDIYIGDISFAQHTSKTVPYKVILGNVDFANSAVKRLGRLEFIGGSVYFEDSIIENLDYLKCIKGNAYFMDSKVTDLGQLQSIGGNADFYYSNVRDLGQLQSIGRDADFEGSELIDLGQLQSIGGDVNFRFSKLTDLGQLQIIGGSADFRGSKVTNLGQLQRIGGFAYFENSEVTDLGQLQRIGENAQFEHSKLTDLGQLQRIGGNADFMDSKVTNLGQLHFIGGDAYFMDSKVTDLGQLQSIGGDADFWDSKVTDLGQLQNIGGSADFRGSKVTNLGQLQRIGGFAYFGNSEVTDLGQLHFIGLDAYFMDSEVTDLGQLQSIGGNTDFRYSKVTDLGQLQSVGKEIYWGEREDLKIQYERRKKDKATDDRTEENSEQNTNEEDLSIDR